MSIRAVDRTVDLDRWARVGVLATCCASMILVVMDLSIVNVALPSIRHDLDASVSGLAWTVDAYTLVLASFLLLAGSTADRVGRRRVFRVGLTVFGLGSLACALAPGIGWLVTARAMQAVGGSMLNPVALAIIATTFTERRERARAIGVFGAMSGLGLALGPIVGGVLVDAVGWRAVFAINLPVVVAALTATRLFVPESRAERARRFDLVGQVLVTTTLASVVYATLEAGTSGWGSTVVLGLLALAAACVLGLVAYEQGRADPLLELRLFRSLPFSSAILMAVLATCGFGAFLFVSTLYLQEVRDLSAMHAGLSLLPVGGLVALLSPVAGRLVAARGPRPPLVVAGSALALGGLASLGLRSGTSMLVVLAVFALFGVFQGTINLPITTTAVAGMPPSMTGTAASLASTGRQVGISLGVAVAGSIVGASRGRSFTDTTQAVWWMVLCLGTVIVVLGVLSTRADRRRFS
ncbi:MFS transporter [Aeromicrobium terrae]|uniref:MFS transporter n=1 Tax=Aeromicrobium terrae TaxID=2498846 RepID=A0A5C8NK88_9ACTN|nr:MFS transporter [Aeromicrobium terrae]TXL60873.1 MFS transporter [Aeromicrobium terrae]